MQSFEFEIDARNHLKFVHTLSRSEALGGSITAISRLGIPALIGDNEPVSIKDLHKKLLRMGIIENKDVGPLTRMMRYLSCYGIFHVENDVIRHSVLSKTLKNPAVFNQVTGLDFNVWKTQGDLIQYFSHHPEVAKIFTSTSTMNFERSQLTLRAESPETLMLELANLQLLSRALYTTSRLNLADIIDETHPTVEALAEKLGKPLTGVNALVSLLMHFHLIERNQNNQLILTATGLRLKDGKDGESIKASTGMANQYWWNSIGNLDYCLRTGNDPYINANSMPVFDYLESDMDERERFDRGLKNGDFDADAVVGSDEVAYAGYKSIVDVGGGAGGLIALIKSRYPEAEATLFEQPGTIEHLTGSALLKDCVLQAGNFLADKPEDTQLPKHKQLYVIKGVLHDFKDDEVVKILKNIRAAMSPLSELKIVDRNIINDNQRNPNKTVDILMMGFFASKERTFEDYQKLAEKAGLTLEDSSVRICGDYNIITAKRVAPENKLAFFLDEKNDQTAVQTYTGPQATK